MSCEKDDKINIIISKWMKTNSCFQSYPVIYLSIIVV